jgi:hypothetical protein
LYCKKTNVDETLTRLDHQCNAVEKEKEKKKRERKWLHGLVVE